MLWNDEMCFTDHLGLDYPASKRFRFFGIGDEQWLSRAKHMVMRL
jgi:hypothetical protein